MNGLNLARVLLDVSPALYIFLILRNYLIIPQIIDNAQVPTETVTVRTRFLLDRSEISDPLIFLNMKKKVAWQNFAIRANLGNEVTPAQMRNQPFVTYLASNQQFYTLVMVDPGSFFNSTYLTSIQIKTS
jgi:hypothetical protein